MNKTLWCACLVLLSVFVCTGDTKPAYDLDKVEKMACFVGSEEARGLLAENGFVVTDQQFNQIFSAYIDSDIPKFVTVDSAWHTYHVLLEDAVRSLEQNQVGNLLVFSRQLYAVAKAKSKQPDDIYDRIADFGAVGWVLQEPGGLDELHEDDRTDVKKVVESLRDGTGILVPLFFEFPLLAERFRASSFYTSNESLRGYYMARQWYATCDFRQKSRKETEIALCLVMLIQSNERLRHLYSKLSEPYDALLGPTDDADIEQYFTLLKEIMGDAFQVEDIPENIDRFLQHAADFPDPKVNDQLLPDRTTYQNWVAETKGFRLFGSRCLPSSVILQNSVDPYVKGRMLPSGLDFFASGAMQCDRAYAALQEDPEHAKYAQDIASVSRTDLPDSMHGEAMALLKLLQEAVPKTAPQPLQGPCWRDKQLWTELGAWMEQRHTWALHTKLTVHYLGLTSESSGYVSPYPKFFRHLATLVRRTAKELEKSSAAPDPRIAGDKLLTSIEVWKRIRTDPVPLERDDYAKAEELLEFLEYYVTNVSKFEPTSEIESEKLLMDITELAQKWRDSEALTEDDRKLVGILVNSGGSAVDLMPEFAELCDALAKIADKELAGTKLNNDDTRLIRDYGQELARFHFYRGNSWLEPRDDFPLITPLFVSPMRRQTLYAGLSRPEALYVIIDVDGQHVLHRGAVLSYREFSRTFNCLLDDDAWRAEVKRGVVPGPPFFTVGFRKTITEGEVVEIIRNGGVYEAVNTVPGKKVTAALVEALLKNEPENDSWLRSSLVARVDNDDIPSLVRVLKHGDDDDVGEIAMCIAQLSWAQYRSLISDLLHSEKAQHADCAAYIMASNPESIETDVLMATYKDQPVRTRRLYCYLLGKSGKAAVLNMLVGATQDKNDGLRYQAAKAIRDVGVKDKEVMAKLVTLLEDPNEFVAEAAACALFQLNAEEAAPAMLARLRKCVGGRDVRTSSNHDQKEAVFKGTSYSGAVAVMVLGEDHLIRSSTLAGWLIDSMARFKYLPAEACLEELVRGNYGKESLVALKCLDPDGHRDRVMAVALDTDVRNRIREYAVEEIVALRDKSAATAIAPLLRDISQSSFSYNGEPWRICDAAAIAIATILEWKGPLPERSNGEGKAVLLKRAREWADDQEEKVPEM